jgi:hypothetical protein
MTQNRAGLHPWYNYGYITAEEPAKVNPRRRLMARGAEFHEGVQGDLFLDHFQGAVGTERVGLDSDSTGRLIFLSHDTPSDGADVTAYKQGQEGYEDIGYLAARRARASRGRPHQGWP